MINIKRILLYTLLLPVFSCQHIDSPVLKKEEGSPVFISMGTKALDGEHTYRVIMTDYNGNVIGNGTYCSETIVSDEMSEVTGAPYSWLSPCRVDDNGVPQTEEGTDAASFEEADKASIYGLRHANTGQAENVFLSVVSPAIALHPNSTYYDWTPDKELFLSSSIGVSFEGSWANYQYIFPANDSFQLLEQRAKLFVRIECKEQSSTDIQKVSINHITRERWYAKDGFSTSEYSKETETWFDCKDDPSKILHLVRQNGDHWDYPSDNTPIYILPFDYSDDTNRDMRPQLEIILGSDVNQKAKIYVSLAEKIDPMKSYQLNLKVSKSHSSFELLATDWDNGGILSTSDEEQWAIIAAGDLDADSWVTPGVITTDDWNTTL